MAKNSVVTKPNAGGGRICRVCNAENTTYICETPNRHSKTQRLHHYRCAACGSVFVGDNIDKEELGVAYSNLDAARYYDEIQSENRKKMAHAVSDLKRLISGNDRIIDIGTGNGLFVEFLHNAGFTDVSAHEIKGADLSKIKQIARNLYEDFDYSSIPSNSFDAITLLDVVEHVPNPEYLAKMCSRILKIGGTIYFHTPVVTTTDRMMHMVQKLPVLNKVGVLWQRGRTTVFHLQNYTPKALTLLLKRAGFTDINIVVKNELSWPVTRYIRTYLLENLGLPGSLAPIFLPVFYPFLATNLFNANKAIVVAKKA